MRCESCHQREATVEYRRNTEGAHQVYQLCERCAANLPDGDEVARAPGELLGALSEDADEVLQAAAQRAVARGAAVILPEDLLAGILDTPCAAQDLLREAGIGLDDVERRLPRPVEGELLQRRRAKLAPALKLALELARQEAKAARLATVSPGLLLLGLLLEGDSAAAKLLRDHGIKPDLLRERVRQAPPFGLPPRRQGVTRLPRHLAKYTSDLTAAAAAGRLDAVIGREAEIGRLIRILARRSKNNPVLIGESGVGKTAIVEGLAQRIATGRVPQGLRDKLLLSLDLAGMVAGARYRGDFEERLKGLLREIQGMGGRVLLFIDELHTVIGAGTAEGSTLDASHMLKPILARRELQCIGATTLEEYRKHIERDAALERRFQPILVAEPTVEATIAILRGLKPSYEAHHGVTVTDEALVAAAELAEKYVQDRLLPDKAIDLLDEACAARQLEERPGTAVGPDDIAEVVSEWTGVPVRKLLQAEGTRLLEMEHHLRRRVIGQEEAVEAVSEAVRRARSGLKDPRRPIGSFIFTGPTGVGKTELARALAEFLFQDEEAMLRFDMSEYMDKASASRLMGAPPGYAGYEDAGQLTEAVRRKPYSVVLFDEIEKAHPDIFNVLLQILDDGRLTDARGRVADFKNTVIILTSNLGAPAADEEPQSWEALRARMLAALREEFRPEFLNRIDETIVFHPLGRKELRRVVAIMLAETARKLHAQQMSLAYSEAATDAVAEAGFDPAYGARPLRRAIQREIENPLARRLLHGEFKAGDAILVDHGPEGFTFAPRAHARGV